MVVVDHLEDTTQDGRVVQASQLHRKLPGQGLAGSIPRGHWQHTSHGMLDEDFGQDLLLSPLVPG